MLFFKVPWRFKDSELNSPDVSQNWKLINFNCSNCNSFKISRYNNSTWCCGPGKGRLSGWGSRRRPRCRGDWPSVEDGRGRLCSNRGRRTARAQEVQSRNHPRSWTPCRSPEPGSYSQQRSKQCQIAILCFINKHHSKEKGRWTRFLIRNVKIWPERCHGNVGFHLT